MSVWQSRVLNSLLAVSGLLFSSVAFGQAVAEKPAMQKESVPIQSQGTPAYKTSLERVTYDIKLSLIHI